MDGWDPGVTEEPRQEALSEAAVMEQLEAQLEPLFKDLPNEIPLLLFTRPGKNDLFSSAARFLIRAVREVAPKVTLREFDLGHKTAQQWNIDRSPTLLIDPDHYRIRWLGAPMIVKTSRRRFLTRTVLLATGATYRHLNVPGESRLSGHGVSFCSTCDGPLFKGYVKRDERHRTDIPGIYAAGDVEGGYKQIVTATGQGAEAAMAVFEDLVNPYWKRKEAAA